MSAETLKPGNIRIAEEADYVGRVLRGERHPGIEIGLTSNLDGYQGIPCVGRIIHNERRSGGRDMDDLCFSLSHFYPDLRALLRLAGIHPGALNKVAIVATLVADDHTAAIDVIPHIDPRVANNTELAGDVLIPGHVSGRIRLMPALPKGEGLLSITSFDKDDKPVARGANEHVFAFALQDYGERGPEAVRGFLFKIPHPADLFQKLCMAAFNPDLEYLR